LMRNKKPQTTRRSQTQRKKKISNMNFQIKPCLLILFIAVPTCHAFSATAPTQLDNFQDRLLQNSQPLEPTFLDDALTTLERDGVVRIQTQVPPALCTNLRQRIMDEIKSGDSNWNVNSASSPEEDKKFIPGTRLRFSLPMDLAFAGDARHDLLLPLTNNLEWSQLTPVLQSVVGQLLPFYCQSVERMLPRFSHDSNAENIELVELASLVSRPGNSHQPLHGDYRRFHDALLDSMEPQEHTQQRRGKLPPRLVTFVALQDVPSIQHGATGFLTGTHNVQAHQWMYEGDQNENEDLLLNQLSNGVRTASGFQCGDILVYDASVLHWGGANSVPNNDRTMLYFGVARSGAAEHLSVDEEVDMMVANMGFEQVSPVLLRDLLC